MSRPPDVCDAVAAPKPRGRWRRRAAWAVGLVVVLLVVVEVSLRVFLGLGDPPLYIADSKIEYLFKPDATYTRFGNRIHLNHWSMRSDEFAQHKTDPREFRVMVLGDSVINGGAMTDQRDLATSILQRDLSGKMDRRVVVGNISAGSWGPQNLLAYVDRFGFFDADVIVVVLSSHDAADVPTFKPIVDVRRSHPGTRPLCAISELVARYLWPRLGSGPEPPYEPGPDSDPRAVQGLRQLLTRARATGARVLFAQHLERDESPHAPRPGHDILLNTARDLNIPVIQLGPALHAVPEAYRDGIHPGPVGQRLIAQTLEPHILPHS